MRRNDSFEKILMLGKTEGRKRRGHRGWDGWMASPTQWTWVWVNSGSWWWKGRPGVLHSMGSQRVWHKWGTELICRFFLTDFSVCLQSKEIYETITRIKNEFSKWQDTRLKYKSSIVSVAAAAAAKSLQSCPTLCDPRDGTPPGPSSLGFSRQEH